MDIILKFIDEEFDRKKQIMLEDAHNKQYYRTERGVLEAKTQYELLEEMRNRRLIELKKEAKERIMKKLSDEEIEILKRWNRFCITLGQDGL